MIEFVLSSETGFGGQKLGEFALRRFAAAAVGMRGLVSERLEQRRRRQFFRASRGWGLVFCAKHHPTGEKINLQIFQIFVLVKLKRGYSRYSITQLLDFISRYLILVM